MKWTLKYSNQAKKFLDKNSLDYFDALIRAAVKKVILKQSVNFRYKKDEGRMEGLL